MKILSIASLMVLLYIPSLAQTEPTGQPISIAYFGNFLFQPGLKVGTQMNVKSWEKEKDRKNGQITKLNSLFISPQFAVFTRPEINTNFMLNTDFGLNTKRLGKKTYSAFSIGLGYLLQRELLSFSVDLSTGDKTNKIKESRHHFVPTINYELGGQFNPKVHWYTKYSIGNKMFGNTENSMVVFVELGTKIYFSKNSNSQKL